MSDSGKSPPLGQDERARELLREIAELRESRARRMESLVNIDNKLAFLEREYAELLGSSQHQAQSMTPSTKPAYGSVRNAILERLFDANDGLTSGQLMRSLRARFGSNIHSKSHLQALKRLGQEGLATKSGDIWRLTNAGADTALRLRTWE